MRFITLSIFLLQLFVRFSHLSAPPSSSFLIRLATGHCPGDILNTLVDEGSLIGSLWYVFRREPVWPERPTLLLGENLRLLEPCSGTIHVHEHCFKRNLHNSFSPIAFSCELISVFCADARFGWRSTGVCLYFFVQFRCTALSCLSQDGFLSENTHFTYAGASHAKFLPNIFPGAARVKTGSASRTSS